MRSFLILLLILSVLGDIALPAQRTHRAPKAHSARHSGALADRMTQSTTDLLQATENYRASLEKLLPFHEQALQRANEDVEKRKQLFAMGAISRQNLEESERRTASAQEELEKTHRQLAEADNLMAEARAAEKWLKAAPGTYDATSVFIRYNGPTAWTLSGAVKIKSFFLSRFGHALPISAFGQTSVHDRLGFDHRHAMDVALHPDSAEGRALLDYLRNAGISFIAFRSEVPGSATGAHIHIGRPSSRLS